jgi:hypothetical protein
MARVPYLNRNDLPEADRFIWDDFVRVREPSLAISIVLLLTRPICSGGLST